MKHTYLLIVAVPSSLPPTERTWNHPRKISAKNARGISPPSSLSRFTRNYLVDMATSLDKSEVRYRSFICTQSAFIRWKKLRKSVQYIRRYSTKYAIAILAKLRRPHSANSPWRHVISRPIKSNQNVTACNNRRKTACWVLMNDIMWSMVICTWIKLIDVVTDWIVSVAKAGIPRVRHGHRHRH